mmetsp:Transcript_5479/g.20515  ORF Transcript_5479/g.20515 Transcript_5479/m.20515 type:complete len:227 (+) Transcript_5479:875-1555(+)
MQGLGEKECSLKRREHIFLVGEIFIGELCLSLHYVNDNTWLLYKLVLEVHFEAVVTFLVAIEIPEANFNFTSVVFDCRLRHKIESVGTRDTSWCTFHLSVVEREWNLVGVRLEEEAGAVHLRHAWSHHEVHNEFALLIHSNRGVVRGEQKVLVVNVRNEGGLELNRGLKLANVANVVVVICVVEVHNVQLCLHIDKVVAAIFNGRVCVVDELLHVHLKFKDFVASV